MKHDYDFYWEIESYSDILDKRKIGVIISRIKHILAPLGYECHIEQVDMFSISKEDYYYYSTTLRHILYELWDLKKLKFWLLRATAQINNKTSDHSINIYDGNPDAVAIVKNFDDIISTRNREDQS